MYGLWGGAFAGTHAVSWPLATLVVLTLTLPIAAGSWYLVERPLMRLAGARSSRPHPASARVGPPHPAQGFDWRTSRAPTA
jgi:peptidoglycan/LPS O-acetylase OafA/YrhL